MTEPTPVTPLSYYERASEPWLPMTRWMSIAAIADSSVFLILFIVRFGLVSWQMFTAPGAMSRINFNRLQSYLEIPAAGAAIVFLIGAVLTLRIRGGRRMVSIGAIVFAVSLLIESIINNVSSIFRFPSANAFPIVSAILLMALFSTLQRCVTPVLIWFYFRRPAVVELFEAARG